MKHQDTNTLKQSIMSQTWNEQLMIALVEAIQDDLKNPKPQKESSLLQAAIHKGKGIKSPNKQENFTEAE